MENIRFQALAGSHTGYRLLLWLLIILIGAGLIAAHHIESQGHWVTGMDNRVVWGLPHVFAIFGLPAMGAAIRSVGGCIADRRTGGACFGLRPTRPTGCGDDVLQLQVGVRLEYIPVHRFCAGGAGLSVGDDDAGNARLCQIGGGVRFDLAVDLNLRHRGDIRISCCAGCL